MPDNISKLYQELKGTYELGSENDFRKYLSDGKKREALRKELEADYEVGDSTSFTKYLGLDAQPQQPAKPQPTQAPQQQAPTPLQMPQGFGQFNIQQANQMGAGRGPVSWEQPEPKQETVVDKTARMMQGKATPQEQKQVQSRMQQRKDEIAYKEATGKDLRQPVLNTEFEAPTVSRDEDGNILIGNTTDQDRVNAHQQVMAEQAAWDSLSDKEKQEKMKQMQLEMEQNEYEEPGFLGVTGKKLGSGFIKAGLGLLNGMKALASGMIVEDASSPTGYSKTEDYDPTKNNDAINRGLEAANQYAERMSREGEPRKGAGFTDMLLDGDIGGFLLKGWGSALESAPMTLSIYNPYTMALNAISMAGNNFRENTIENPDIPVWKRASMAIGSAAIEQAVEKFSDPVFKYFNGGRILSWFGKKASEETSKKIAKEAESILARRIMGVIKDAAAEGAEEVVTNFGNDALGQALDWMDGEAEYGIVAQWKDYKKLHPNADLAGFAMQKAKENLDSFFGGALGGAYMSGSAQITAAGFEYATGHTVSPEQMANPTAPIHPATLDIAQSYDEGYTMDNEQDVANAKANYEAQRQRATEILGETKGLDKNPTQTLQTMQDGLQDGSFTPEQVQAALDYVDAKATVDGIQQRIVEDNRANRHNFVANGNNIDEIDAQGNVVATHEYENADEMRTALWEMQAKREHDDVMTDINIAKTNPKYDYDGIIGAFAEETGLDVDYIESILNKDPLELEDPESAMVAEFAEILHNTIYDNTKVHEEQSAQDGANLADEMGIDLNNLLPAQVEQAQQITADFSAAQQALNQAFAADENLQQEVERLENEGMPKQGIVSTLGELGFRPNQVQAVIDYYNADAKYKGFVLQMSNKIDEAAANERQRHTMKGTIDGVADLNNVHTISDGTNEYFLVSGDITTDPATGRITGSGSGLIIGMDLDGSFVNISDTDGYSVMPVTQTLDQWEEAERIRLQEQMTATIDPTGSMNPQVQQPAKEQSGNLDNAGGEAGANTGTGANEATVAPSSETQQPVQIPVDEKSGLKRYEQGIPVEQAIQDIQNDGFDVNEMADAYINEAQEAIDKINNKAAKKPQDLIERKRLTDVITYYNNVKARWAEVNAESQPADVPATTSSTKTMTDRDIVLEHDAVWYYLAKKMIESGIDTSAKLSKARWEVPMKPGGRDVDYNFEKEFGTYENFVKWAKENWDEINSNIETWNKRILNSNLTADEKASYIENPIDYLANLELNYDSANAPKSEENEKFEPPKQNIEEKTVSSQQETEKSEKPTNLTVEEQKQQRIAEAKAKYGELFDDDFNKANDVYELVSMWVGRKRNLAWDDVNGKRGLQKELGWTRKIGGDTKYIETLLAKKGEGMGVDEFAHMVWESPENDIMGEKRFSTEEIKEALLDLLKSAQSKSDVVDYALNTREQQARAALAEQQKQAEEKAANQGQEPAVAPFTEEELAQMEANLPFAQSTDEEIPDSPIVQLMKAIEELRQQEGMPEIRLVDTDRMSDDEWYDIASQAYGGVFVSQEDIDDVRNTILADGVYANPETGAITVYSDSQTAEEVKYKVEQIKDIINGRSNEEETGGLETENVQRPSEGTDSTQEPATPAAEGANGTEGQGSSEPVEPIENEMWKGEDGRWYIIKTPTNPQTGEKSISIAPYNGGLVIESERRPLSYEEYIVHREEDPGVYVGGKIVKISELPNGEFTPEQYDKAVNAGDKRYKEYQNEAKKRIDAFTTVEQIEAFRDYFVDKLSNNSAKETLLDNLLNAEERIAGKKLYKQDAFGFFEKDKNGNPIRLEQKSSEQDDYLQPRNAEEEAIIQGVINQLQQEIQTAVEDVDKARADLEKARANESDRATDMFANDQAFTEPDAIFSQEEMGLDTSAEGVERRTRAEREKLQDAVNKLNGLQSEQERNSRIRGALDNHRRQTTIETEPTANPMEAIEQAAQQFKQEQEEKQKPKSNNKVFTDEAHEEVLKKLRAKFNNLNAGFDPEIALLMLQDAGYHIEKGARKIAECAKAMIDELGDFVRPYIKSAYNAVRDYPGMEGIANEMSSFEEVRAFDPLNFDKAEQQTVNVNKNENNEAEKDLSLQSETINSDNNGLERSTSNVRPEGQRDGNNEGKPSERVRQGAQQEDGGLDGQGQAEGREGVGGGNQRPTRRLQGLNKNNNHEERGTESAPTTPRMRTQANIEAIRLMQQIVEEDRPATDEEKKILRKFSGWGGLGVAFEDPTYSEELRSLLGDAAYDQAQMSRNSAYFTPANIIDALWDIAKALGFKGGNVLEGSAGIGKIIGLMPSELSDSSNIQAVEIDETTGNILKLLYPDAQVDIQGFEDTKIPNGSIDLAITNVPFVTGLRVQDTTGDKDLSKMFHDIHDFCIAKNIRKLREGGIGIFITSNGTLDNSQKLRDWIISEGGADVVGAFRLNNKTFGGTGTTSDIIVVRKRVNGQKSPNAIDVSLPSAVRGVEYDTGETKKVKGQEVPVIKKLSMDYNGYFVEHPEHMGGEMVFNFEIGETYRPTSKTLTPGGVNQDERLNAWVDEMSKKDWSKEASAETSEPEKPQYEKYGEGVKEGSLILDSKGNICIAQYGEAVPLGVNDKKVKGRSKQECLKDYNAIKNALNEVLNYQVEHEDNDGLQPLLDKFNKAYNQFVAKYGHFHNNTAIAFLRNDVDYASVGALETYKEKTDKDGNKTPVYGKADVFSKRVVEKEKEPQPKNIEDGVIASIYKYNGINIPYIAQQLGMSEEEAKEEILDKGLGFENPDTTQVEVNYVYLSGNVREKLEKAKANNANGKYAKNISALEKIIPADIPAHLIEFNLGSTWIDKELYKEFFKEKTGKNATFNDANGTWFLGYDEDYTPKDAEGAVFSELCDKTILTSQLIEAAMTGRTIKVQKTEKGWDGKTETITDNEATQACAARIDELKQDFKDWARAKMQADPEIAEKAEKAYNEKFNNYVPLSIPKEFAPSHFGGQNKAISLRPHQSKAVIKGITQPIMFAHGVGAGKTFTLIATAMEMRRIGTAKKPMIVVQNATVGQFTESAKMLYPNAKILTMDDKDHSEAARKQFYAKIKYNDWDLIIVPQSVLDKIPDSPDRQLAYINEKIQEKERILMLLEEDPANWAVVNRLRKELDEMYDEEYNLTEASAARSEKKKKRDEKKRAVAKQNAAVRAKEQLDRSVDDVEDFDDMEIDAILVDEAHGYKKLGFGSVMQKVKGVDTGSSKKCASLLLKTRAVLEKSHGKNVVFATGTPVSNTAAEVWTFMRYLMPEEMMEEYGIKFFDDFARNFGNVQQMLEFTTSGKFKENNRFAGYVNMPELARIWASVADTVVVEDQKEVKEKLPEVEGGKATDIYLPQTKALRAVMKYVRQELERYEHMTGKEKKANSYIPLVMYGIAKAAAVDARLVDSTAADEPQSKTNEAVRQTLRSLEETKEYNGTIAIFADNYQNKQSGFNLYEDIKKKLVAQGVPSEQIAIIRSDMSDKKKLDIFDKVNSGEIRVVMGSTQTLGTGVNIQERLHTLIHMDAPNRPMDYTQRNGRIVRQGNLHKEWGIPVRILRFGVEDSLDVTAYQRLKTKGAIADSVMKGDKLLQNAMDSRVLEEEEDVFGDTVAQLSGSEYAMLKNQAEKEVRKLEARYKQWEADQIFIHAQMPRLLGQSDASRLRMEKAEKNLATVEKAMKEPLKIEINGKTYDSLDAMADFFKEYNSKVKAAEDEIRKSGVVQSQERKLTITINGIPFEFKTIITGSRSHEKGKIKFSTMRQTTFNNEDLIGSERNVKGGYIKNGVEEILNDYLSGNDYREIIETEKNSIARNEAQIKMLEERSGKEFTEGEALEKARERLEEYTQKMKEEMEAKEAKYKEMDAEVEASDSVSFDDDEDNEQPPKARQSFPDITDPMEAILAAAEEWEKENGRKDNKNNSNTLSKEKANGEKKNSNKRGKSRKASERKAGGLEESEGSRLLSNGRRRIIDRIGRQLGLTFRVTDEGLDGADAEWDPDTRTVTISVAAAKRGDIGFLKVVGHELTHHIKEVSKEYPEVWEAFVKLVKENFGEEEFKRRFDRRRKKYDEEYDKREAEHLTDEEIEEEVCADFAGEKILTDEKFVKELLDRVDREGGDVQSFVEKMLDFVRDLFERLKAIFEGNDSDMIKGMVTLDTAKEVWADMYQYAAENELAGQSQARQHIIDDPMEAIENAANSFNESKKEAEAVKEYSAKEVYNQRVNTAAFVTSETFQDGMLGLKTLQNAISHDKEVPDSQNAYMAENLMHGKNATEQEMFDSTVRGPLLEVVNRIMQKTGMSYDDIDKYTLTKSGLERNREFFVRDWFAKERRKRIKGFDDLSDEAQEIFNKLANRIETDFEDGIIESEEEKNQKLDQALQKAHKQYLDNLENEYLKLKKDNYQKILDREMDFPNYLKAIDTFIRQNIAPRYKPQNHDYSGLTALYGDENGKYDEAGIIDNLMDTEKKMGILSDILWSRINIASQYGLDRYRQAGMRSDEQLDKIEQMFHWYVPMRGFKEDTAEDMYQYFTSSGEDTKHLGGLIRHAKGRTSEAFSPIVSLINMSYKAITDCNQNMVNQKLYRLVQANPNDLIVLSDSWAELDQNTGEWEAAYPQIPEDATEEEVRHEVMAFEEDMKQKALEGTAKKIKGKADFDYKPASKKMKAQHTVEVYLNGQRKLMTIVGNPRAAQALNGQTRFKADLVPYISDMNTAIKNWMSKASTSYNPTFAARNMLRDWTHFKVILITREGMGYASAAGDYYHPTHMMKLFEKYRAGQLDESVEEERDFKDFMDNGGTTGFIHMMKVESLQKDMQKQLEKMQKKGVLKLGQSTWEGLLGMVEAANEAIENAARFATYRASRHYAGRTKARSAYDAKEVTANFNRRGAGLKTAGFKSRDKKVEAMAKAMGVTAQVLGEGRMFFNATLQAVATIFKNFKNADGSINWPYVRRFASRYALTSFVASNLVTAINMGLIMLFGGDGDDDPYADLPEWVRKKNICIWLGWVPGIEKMLPAGSENTKFFKDQFFTLPIGQELAAFYSLGDLFAGMTYAPNLRPIDFDLYNEFIAFINVFSPVDFETKITEKEGLQGVLPEFIGRVSTVLAPWVAASENVSWTGRRIFRPDKYEGDEDIPEYQMAYNSTNGGFVVISKWLNDWTGGDEVERGLAQVNPGQMQYLVEQYAGGPGKFAMNTGSTMHDLWETFFNEGEDANFNVRKLEVGKAFLQQADDNQKFYRAKAKYEKYRREANKLERDIKKYSEKSVDNPEYYMKALELSQGVDAARMSIINDVERDLMKLNKAIYAAKGSERKRLNDDYNRLVSKVVDELDKVKDIE